MFFQNLLSQEFRGNWVLGDRQYVIEFVCPANQNSSNYQLAWNGEPYDLSVYNMLTLNYAWDIDFKNYSSLSVNVAGAVPGATLASEVVTKLNANAIFAEMFLAQIKPIYGLGGQEPFVHDVPNTNTVIIVPKLGRIKQTIRLWITNAGAEQLLRFNKKAGVTEMPLYMNRHTIANRFTFPDSQGCLVLLDEADAVVDIPIIEQAGFDPSDMLADWELLAGRASSLFTFKKLTIDGSNRITQIIEYPAGAVVGGFARKIQYVYSGGNTNPSQITEIPYVLTSGDLVTP